jgi:hypothetical protein
MAIITTGSHPKHLWPGVYAFFGIAYEDHGMEYPDLVDIRDSSKNYEEMVQNTGFGLAPQKGQGLSVSFDEDSQGSRRASRTSPTAWATSSRARRSRTTSTNPCRWTARCR